MTWQVKGDAHTDEPVQPLPPHCPYSETADPVGAADVEEALEVGLLVGVPMEEEPTDDDEPVLVEP
jgi:hypothetical protein